MSPNEKIRLLQDISGLSQSELARDVGVTFAAYNRCVNKKSILKKILARPDLIEELSLQITYNSNAIEGSSLSKEETREVIFENLALSRPTLNEQLEAKNHHKAFLFLLKHLKRRGKV